MEHIVRHIHSYKIIICFSTLYTCTNKQNVSSLSACNLTKKVRTTVRCLDDKMTK